MNSLVVFLSVVALVAGKPSGLEPLLTSYSAPIISAGAAYAAPAIYSAPAAYAAPALYSAPSVYAAPAAIGASAVSSQSRLDIKSSPAVISTSIEPIARTVISEPAVIATPAIATAAIAPAAVSSQSRIDIKSTPAISSTVVSAPLTYSAPVGIAYGAASLGYNTPILAGAVAPTFLKTAYAAPAFTAAYAAPAAIAGHAVPWDTPEVVAARAAHFEAKALAGAHLIKKRSATLYASPLLSTHLSSPVISTYASAPLLSSVHAAPLAYSAPIAFSTPLITKAYGVHPW